MDNTTLKESVNVMEILPNPLSPLEIRNRSLVGSARIYPSTSFFLQKAEVPPLGVLDLACQRERPIAAEHPN